MKLPRFEEAGELEDIPEGSRTFQLRPEAAQAWKSMRDAAAKQGVELQLVSAFRSIKRQQEIVQGKRERGLSDAEIFRVNAPPGHSEHHSGRAVDISTPGYAPLETTFEHSRAFSWLQQDAGAFGFALSYPRKNPFGIIYEPWHWCWHPSPPSHPR
ncbi:MAG: hypothetical protein SynsKO_09520 [Synoicihabitans sp.]